MTKTGTAALLKQSLPLLGSTLAALVLFAQRSTLFTLLEGAIFCAVAFTLWVEREEKPAQSSRAAAIPGAAFCLIGLQRFVGENYLGSLTGIAALVLASAAFLSIFRLCCRMEELLLTLLPEPNLRGFGNLKDNFLLSLSATAFFLLASGGKGEPGYWQSILAAAALVTMAACRMRPMTELCRNRSLVSCGYALLTAAGVCLAQLEIWQGLPLYLAVIGLLFPLVCIMAMADKLTALMKNLLGSLSRRELALYGGLLAMALAFNIWAFLGSDAYYGTVHPYDIVYTSDSPSLVGENAYLVLLDPQNDLRQPLFAVFAAPFLGLPFLGSRLLGLSPVLHALVMNLPQLCLILLAHVLLAEFLGLAGGKRMGFVLLLSAAYPCGLSVLMMEQYAVAYFYVALTLYALSREKADHTALWGAGGTMLTSMALTPLLARENPLGQFARWYRQVVQAALGFILAMVAFSRLDVLLNLVTNLLNLSQFSGVGLTFGEKLNQYTAFVGSCLAAPKAEVVENMWGVISWQLTIPRGIHWGGVGVLSLCAVSLAVNRKRLGAWVCAGWIALSLAALLVFGWGTQENGLILYALYFGWAFVGLLFLLADRLLGKTPWVAAAGCLGAALLAIDNIPALLDLVRFALEYYPVP